MSDSVSNPSSGFFYQLTLACDLAAVRPAVETAGRTLAENGADPNALRACELALVEACNNAVLYAPPAGRPKGIEIQLSGQGRDLEMQVVDHTNGFDWPTAPELPDPEAEHGRGLFIIQSLMDQALYLRGPTENRLILRKRQLFPLNPSGNALEKQLSEAREKLALAEQATNAMARELNDQIASARAQRQEVDSRLLARELQIARNIQHSLLPRAFPKLPGFGLAGFCLSARQVGGDFYDVLPLSPEVALLVVADVMGKGVPAALFAATLRTLLRTAVQWTRHPAKLLRRINQLMFEDLSGVDMFITAQLALADTRVGRLIVASAGHCPMLLAEPDKVERISPEGMPIGVVRDAEFHEEALPLRLSTCALLYTDGLTESRSPTGELLGQKRLVQWLRQGLSRKIDAAQMALDIQAEIQGFQMTDSPADDQTFLILSPQPRSVATQEPSTKQAPAAV